MLQAFWRERVQDFTSFEMTRPGGLALVLSAAFFVSGGVAAPLEAHDPVPETGILPLLQQTMLALNTSDFDAAIGFANKAVETEPRNAAAYLWLGNAFGRKAQASSFFGRIANARKCREAYREALKLDPENLEVRHRLIDFYMQAPGIVGGGKKNALLEAAAIAKRSRFAGHVAYAQVYIYSREFAHAVREFHRAAEVPPTDLEDRLQVASEYLQEVQRHAFDRHSVPVLASTRLPELKVIYYLLHSCIKQDDQDAPEQFEDYKLFLGAEREELRLFHSFAHQVGRR